MARAGTNVGVAVGLFETGSPARLPRRTAAPARNKTGEVSSITSLNPSLPCVMLFTLSPSAKPRDGRTSSCNKVNQRGIANSARATSNAKGTGMCEYQVRATCEREKRLTAVQPQPAFCGKQVANQLQASTRLCLWRPTLWTSLHVQDVSV
jgi:hypothetical protein